MSHENDAKQYTNQGSYSRQLPQPLSQSTIRRMFGQPTSQSRSQKKLLEVKGNVPQSSIADDASALLKNLTVMPKYRCFVAYLFRRLHETPKLLNRFPRNAGAWNIWGLYRMVQGKRAIYRCEANSCQLFMAALCNRAGHYMLPCGFCLLSSIFFFSSPNLSGRRLDVYHTLTDGVALVGI